VTRSQNTSTDLEEIQGLERKTQDEDDNQLPIMMEVFKGKTVWHKHVNPWRQTAWFDVKLSNLDTHTKYGSLRRSLTTDVKGSSKRLTPGQNIKTLLRFDELIICKSLGI